MYASVEVDDQKRLLTWPSMLEDQQLMGLLIVGPFPEETLVGLIGQTEKPTIIVDAYAPNRSCDCIVVDNLHAADVAVTYLIVQGHRHIGIVGSSPDSV